MEYLDKIIPLAILSVVAAFLLILVRRVARDKPPVPKELPAIEPSPVVETPAAVAAIELPASVVVEPVADVVDVRPVEIPRKIVARLPRLKKRPSPSITAKTMPAPIPAVLGLLKEKDSLAAAFVLHEILGPPVSKRPKGLTKT